MKVGIIGLGTIGKKLCEYLSEKRFEIIAFNYRNLNEKKEEIVANIKKKVKYDKISYNEFEQLISRMLFVEEFNKFNEVDLIIDASSEIYEVKKNIYNKLKELEIKKPLACTTSSLDINTISKYYYKEYVFGLHFFNPPTKMKLIELAFLPENNQNIKNSVYKFLGYLDDKRVIEIPPIQGYIVNRILFVYINFAVKYMMDFSIDARLIDDAMRFGTNVPMGPLELSDYIGNDISLEILNEFYKTTKDERYQPAELLKTLVQEGRLGRKAKIGFYNY